MVGPCGWGRRGSILVWPSVAVGGAGLAPWRGEGGGWAGQGEHASSEARLEH